MQEHPVIESKNVWSKSEIQVDLDENDFNSIDEYIEIIIDDNNYFIPAYKLKYKTPVQFKTKQGFNIFLVSTFS